MKSRYCLPRHWMAEIRGSEAADSAGEPESVFSVAESKGSKRGRKWEICGQAVQFTQPTVARQCMMQKKKRREYVRACCTGGLSTIPALLLRNLSLSLWPDVYTLIDEVCEPSCCCCSDTSRCGRLHPAVTCLPTQRGSDLLLLHHHHHHHPHQAWLFPVWLQEQRGYWQDDAW